MPRKKSGSSQNREKMVDNNTRAREMLIRAGFTDIWLKPHTRFLDWVWSHGEYVSGEYKIIKYQAQDIWNLFDGMCWNNGNLIFLAIGRKFKKEDMIAAFLRGKKNTTVLMIRVSVHGTIDMKMWKSGKSEVHYTKC